MVMGVRKAGKSAQEWPAILTRASSAIAKERPVHVVTPEGCLFGSSLQSIFEVLAAWGAARVTRQKSKDEDPDKEEDDRVNGDLEGEHGDRPASGIAPSSYGSRLGDHDVAPSTAPAIGVD